jgi:hypothetical protein
MLPIKATPSSPLGLSLPLPMGPLSPCYEYSVCESTQLFSPGPLPGSTAEAVGRKGNVFILKISYKEDINRSSSKVQRDPGTCSVEDFLSEEQEAELLKHWDD